MYNDIDNKQLNAARDNTYFGDITNYDFDEVSDTDLKEFARECYKVVDDQASIIADFTNSTKTMPFEQDEWMYQFEEYLLSLFKDKMIDHLNAELGEYMNSAANEMGCC